MSRSERVVQNLNRALHALMASEADLFLLGEDIADPYGGAFRVTAGLSTAYPDRVFSTPVSESGIVGAGAGVALTGGAAVVEIMFADFVALAFDQLLNFASKSASMFGRPVTLRLIVRCPSGGNRGYGPTHSQSLQKHFIGIPGLHIYEMSPFQDNTEVFRCMLSGGVPCIFFEDKVLYSRPMRAGPLVDGMFRCELPASGDGALISVAGAGEADWLVIAPGGLAERVMSAMRALLVERELACALFVPSRLYPFGLELLLPLLGRARRVCVVEDGTADGTWGEYVAHRIHQSAWHSLADPVLLVSAAATIIPAAAHLERAVLVQDATIYRRIAEASR